MSDSHPDLRPVQSSNVKALGHDNRGLFVQFHSGAIYVYPGVTEEKFDEGLASPSVGRWFRSEIKDIFPGRKLDS